VQALMRLIRFRNTHPAFDGTFTVTGGGTSLVATWTAGDEFAALDADLGTGEATVRWTSGGARRSAPLAALR